MKRIMLSVACAVCLAVNAQESFITKGRIEFEKKVNIHKQIDNAMEGSPMGADFAAGIKKAMPQFNLTYFDLLFNDETTLYKPGRDIPNARRIDDWLTGPANDNTVLTNLDKSESISLKTVFSNTFLVSDTVRKIRWRYSPDTRNIAGFECHKAVGVIMDSVYVIAFYTNKIPVDGGPESFAGLPGMILGAAIPRINTTWFATKVVLDDVKPEALKAPQKGKKIKGSDLASQVKDSFKNYGTRGHSFMWQTLL